MALIGFLVFQRSQQVGIGAAAGEVGQGIGSIGGGIQGLLTGIGTGGAQLLNPLFSIVELARQGGILGARETVERPREIATTAAARAASRANPAATYTAAPSGVPGYTVRSVAPGSPARAAPAVSSAINDARVSERLAFRQELRAGFDALASRGERALAPYRGYYRDLQAYLTPEQRELL